MSFLENAGDALRLATWRTAKAPDARLSGMAIAGLLLLAILSEAGAQLLISGGAFHRFTPYGLNSTVAAFAIDAVVILAFASVDRSFATARNLFLLYVVWIGLGMIVDTGFRLYFPDYPHGFTTASEVASVLIPIVWVVWLIGGARSAFKSAPNVRRPGMRGAAFVVVMTLATMAAPAWPIFASNTFDRRMANAWEMYKNYAADRSDSEKDREAQRAAEVRAAQLEAKQNTLLETAVNQMEPRDPAGGNIFVVGLAGWADQDVFVRETQQSLDILASHFHLGRRSVSLINHDSTVDAAPMASMQNLAAALRAVGARMDPDKDVLVLTMTSHGSPDGFALNYYDFVERTLDPQTLRGLLDEAHIKYRILIVSSCYSGTFVAPLSDPNTMILTAASSSRTSFGCSNDRKWTWFGEAFFQDGLTGEATLAGAFASARTTIAAWEREQKLTPSEPQAFIGDEISRRFPNLVGSARELKAQAAETKTRVSEE